MKNTNKKNNASINIDDIFGHDRKELDNCFEICYIPNMTVCSTPTSFCRSKHISLSVNKEVYALHS